MDTQAIPANPPADSSASLKPAPHEPQPCVKVVSPYFTLEEAAAYARCSTRTVQRWLAAGDLTRHGHGAGVLILKAELEAELGPDLERRCPFVFVSATVPEGTITEQALRWGIRLLVKELRGEDFNPHKVRHIVASYLVNEHGSGGLGLAAELLGDTVDVVLKTCYRPDTTEALGGYLGVRAGPKKA